ncbi:PREDICTED: uncharacterized protein LOC109132474 [Camelina sativa]|uniref:Uncharacterized protein LOC109132474 n=1 Tax=Camelina sativa TaxID=90675 RepID=A0ABM1RKV2_CAMSA|nr:PREDICTED: uncharacterized protein LOC109132474 [Camelina sativa]
MTSSIRRFQDFQILKLQKEWLWSPPPDGWLKCNFDSGFVMDRSFTNTGWILRDSNGKMIMAGGAKLRSSISPLQAEALGFLHVLQVMWTHGLRYIWFESDNRQLVTLINKGEDNVVLGPLLNDIRFWISKFPNSSLDHVNRERNSAADTIAKQAATNTSMYTLYTVPPCWLVDYLYQPYTI